MGFFDRIEQVARAFAPVPMHDPLDVTPTAATADSYADPSSIPKGSGNTVGGLWQSTSALINAVTGVGTSRDPSSANAWAIPRTLLERERFGMGRNALIQQAIGKMPATAVREGWRVDITDERVPVEDREPLSDMVAAYEERLSIGTKTARAVFRGRQYSSGFVLLGIDDGRTYDQPVNKSAIQSVKWAAVMDSRDYTPYELFQAGEDDFGQVKRFLINDVNGVLEDGLRYGENAVSFMTQELETAQKQQSGQLLVHSDRVLFFPTADYLPMLDSLQDALGAFFEAMSGIRTAAREASTVVYKIDNWIRKMWSKNSALATLHMGFVDRAKSALNAWVIDKDHEDVTMVSRSLSGVPQLADPFMVWLAAALGIPVTVLWGVSPGGFGKGEAERETWHEAVRAFQNQVLAPQLKKLHGYILAAQDGGALVWREVQREIAFEDLSPPDEETRSRLRTEAIADLTRIFEKGGITRDEYREGLAALSDEFFRLTLTEEGKRVSKDAAVGAITGTIALMQAVALGLPAEAAERALAKLLPSNFDPASAAFVFEPLKAKPADVAAQDPTATPEQPATGEAPTPGTLAATDPNAPEPVDEEDGDAEPSEVDIVWSEVEPPAGARTAKELAEDPELGVTGRQVKQLARAGLTPAYKPRGFSKEPLFLREEVQAGLLKRQGHMAEDLPAATAEPAADAAPNSLCITIRLPPELALWVPYKAEDSSPPHVTVLYVYDVPAAMVPAVRDVVAGVLASLTPFDAQISGASAVDYFDQSTHPTKPRDGRVAFAHVQLTADEQALFDSLALVVESLGLKVSRFKGYTPHTTLAYIDGDADYEGPVPEGSWTVEELELWYGDDQSTRIALGAPRA